MLKKYRLQMVVSSLLAASLTACGGGTASLPGTVGLTSSNDLPVTSSLPRATMAAAMSAAQYVAIDAGGSAAGAYRADTDFNTGSVAVVANAINTSLVTNPAPQSAYQSQRYGANFVYTVPNLTPNAPYSVRLHFVESFFSGSGQRVFGVTLNGVQALSNFDVFKAAGGRNIAIAKSFTATADASGKIAISFAATANDAAIAAIEVGTSTGGPTAAPIAPGISISAGGSGSGAWLADTDYNGGWVSSSSAAVNTSHVANPAPQAVYATQRVGATFAYAVPNLTPGAAYSVRLDFVEPFFTSAGQRAFNVSLNGSKVLSNFDIYAAAGGENVAVAKTFAAVADTTGKITLQFAATANNASITAIGVAGGTAAATPTPPPVVVASPTPVPTSAPPTVPTGNSAYYNYSAAFTGNTPFHHKVATLLNGYAVRDSNSSTEVTNWINNPYGHMSNNHPYQGGTFYVSKSSDTRYSWNGLNEYGSGNLLIGQSSHVPSYAVSQDTSDHHLIVDDPFGSSGGGEYGGIECDGNGYGSGPLGCGWGAFYAYSGSGLSVDTANGWSSFTRGGYASGLGVITAYDLQSAAQGSPIAHALMLTTNCTTDNSSNSTPQIYPSFGAGSDARCPDTELTYGALVHLTMTPSQIVATGASQYCKYILNALATYGMYVTDNTGNPYGASLELQSPAVYDQSGQTDYITKTVEPSLLGGGDASGGTDSYPGNTSSFGWSTCLNRVWNPGDWEVLHITTKTAGLPPKSVL
jgi:hypothetical protein